MVHVLLALSNAIINVLSSYFYEQNFSDRVFFVRPHGFNRLKVGLPIAIWQPNHCTVRRQFLPNFQTRVSSPFYLHHVIDSWELVTIVDNLGYLQSCYESAAVDTIVWLLLPLRLSAMFANITSPNSKLLSFLRSERKRGKTILSYNSITYKRTLSLFQLATILQSKSVGFLQRSSTNFPKCCLLRDSANYLNFRVLSRRRKKSTHSHDSSPFLTFALSVVRTLFVK